MTSHDPVPNFYLYGEPHRSVADHFLHVESLDDRSRPAGWTIRPHAHQELNHLILITEGRGVMLAEGEVSRFDAPCLVLVPAYAGALWLGRRPLMLGVLGDLVRRRSSGDAVRGR